MTKGKIELTQGVVKTVDIVLLIIHSYLLVFFAVMHVNAMVVVNVFSVGIYFKMIPMPLEKLEKFVLAIYCEVLLHMILAVVCVGWDFGFQFYSFALIPVMFYYDYLQRSKIGKRCYPVAVSLVVVVAFGAMRAYTWYCGAIYEVNYANVKLFSNIMNALFIFIFLIFFMANYESLTINSDIMASRDQLTGLNNRHKMDEIMKMILEQKGRQEIAIAIMDIDDFKKVNDTYGHNAGDEVLKSVAGVVGKVQDKSTFACRWGGEEFLVISFGSDCYQRLQEKMEQLVRNVSKREITCQEDKISVTITAGISQKIEEETIDRAISRADKCLYQGKMSGKNKLVSG